MSRIIALFSLTILTLTVASWKAESALTSQGKQEASLAAKALPEQVGKPSAILRREPGNHDVRLVSGEDEIGTISASDNLPIEGSEFYYPGMMLEGVGAVREPKWAMELEARGKTGSNVLKANSTGSAPAITGHSEPGRRYVFGFGVALTKKNNSVEIKLISKTGQVMRSLALSSTRRLFWRGELGEFAAGTDNSPERLEITSLRGKAHGFLSIMDVETNETRLLTLVPGKNSGRRGEIHTASTQGTAYFTNGILNCPGSSYAYEINGGPPNSCGELHIVRNGVSQTTSCWAFTDAGGHALMGPWTVSTNQTGTSIYIQWPDGSTTTGDDYKIDDNSAPSVQIDTCGSSVIEGSASDTQWGVGFSGSSVLASFRQTYSPYKYWDGSGYNSSFEYFFYCSVSPFFGGYNINWSIVPPASAGTTQVHVIASDVCNTANAYCTY